MILKIKAEKQSLENPGYTWSDFSLLSVNQRNCYGTDCKIRFLIQKIINLLLFNVLLIISLQVLIIRCVVDTAVFGNELKLKFSLKRNVCFFKVKGFINDLKRPSYFFKVTEYINFYVQKNSFCFCIFVFKEKQSFFSMNSTNIGAIPAQCRRCGELFDLSYDLKEISNERLLFELLKATRNPRTALCWECRQEKAIYA